MLCDLVVDYVTGKYKEIPLASIITIVAALVYFLSPIDLFPEPLPIIGYIDDAAVIGFAIMALHIDIQSYKVWKVMIFILEIFTGLFCGELAQLGVRAGWLHYPKIDSKKIRRFSTGA